MGQLNYGASESYFLTYILQVVSDALDLDICMAYPSLLSFLNLYIIMSE